MQDKRPICAIATAPGQGAIGVVRVSAPEAGIIEAIAREVLGASLSGAAPNMPPGSGKTVGISQTVSGMAVTSVVAHRPLKPRHASYGPFLAEGGQPIDYGLALWFPAPHSYTGEHIFELQGHGGPVVQQILLRRVLQVGQAIFIPTQGAAPTQQASARPATRRAAVARSSSHADSAPPASGESIRCWPGSAPMWSAPCACSARPRSTRSIAASSPFRVRH